MRALLILAVSSWAQAPLDPGRCIVEERRLARSLAVGPDWTPLDDYPEYAALRAEERRGWNRAQAGGDSTGWRERIDVERPAGALRVSRYWAAKAADSLALTWVDEYRLENGRVQERRNYTQTGAASGTPLSVYTFTYLADGPLAGRLSEYRVQRLSVQDARRYLYTYRPDGIIGEALTRRILTGDPAGRREENEERFTWTPIASGERATQWKWSEVSGLWSAHAAVDLIFDSSNRLISLRTWFLGQGNNLLMGRTDYRYDSRGRVVRAFQYQGEAGKVDTTWASAEDRFAYDDTAGRVTEDRIARDRADDTAGIFRYRKERVFDPQCRERGRKEYDLRAMPPLVAWSESEPVLHSVSIRSRKVRAHKARGAEASVDALGRRAGTERSLAFRPAAGR